MTREEIEKKAKEYANKVVAIGETQTLYSHGLLSANDFKEGAEWMNRQWEEKIEKLYAMLDEYEYENDVETIFIFRHKYDLIFKEQSL